MENIYFIDKLINYYELTSHSKNYLKKVIFNLTDIDITEHLNLFTDTSHSQHQAAINKITRLIYQWKFINSPNNVRYCKDNKQVCELCGRPENVYQYKIINESKSKPIQIWVGSTCIKRFNIPIIDNGKYISNKRDINHIFKDYIKNNSIKDNSDNIIRLIDWINKNINSNQVIITPENINSRRYTLNQVNYISVKYYKITGEYLPPEYYPQFNIDFNLNENINKIKTFSKVNYRLFIYYAGVMPEKFYSEKYGFDNNVIDKIIKSIPYNDYDYELLASFFTKLSNVKNNKEEDDIDVEFKSLNKY